MGCEAAAVFPKSVCNNMLVVVILCTFYLVCPSMSMASTDMVLVCMKHLLNKVCQKIMCVCNHWHAYLTTKTYPPCPHTFSPPPGVSEFRSKWELLNRSRHFGVEKSGLLEAVSDTSMTNITCVCLHQHTNFVAFSLPDCWLDCCASRRHHQTEFFHQTGCLSLSRWTKHYKV